MPDARDQCPAAPASAGATISIEPIGHVVGGRVPAEDDDWGQVRARIELVPRFGPDALAGLDEFSHIEVVFHFDRQDEAKVVSGARHPRGRADWPKVGIFAQRGKARPNRIGVSVCRMIAVHGTALEVEGLDAVHGTPVLDIKPVMAGFQPRGEICEPEWAREIMADYW
jgi:tRNA-Thr(GGU) m(6)t(6)A37 methyltransferase TsaA